MAAPEVISRRAPVTVAATNAAEDEYSDEAQAKQSSGTCKQS
jgi:hypothetical protein